MNRKPTFNSDQPRRRHSRWLSIPLSDWPVPDRLAWDKACSEGDILEAGGIAAQWAPSTRKVTEAGYGRWLCWLRSQGLLDASQKPEERASRDAVAAYAASLQPHLGQYTIASYLQQLSDALRAMAEDHDWGWILRASGRIRECAVPVRNKRSQLQPPQKLVELGRALMASAEARHDRDLASAALEYRTGLMIAFLAHRPVRVSNLAAMTYGQHLVHDGCIWRVAFDCRETKNRRPLEFPFPKELGPDLERYLDVYRPELLGKHANPTHLPSGPLWPSIKGDALQAKVIGHHIMRRTKMAFGQAINPHLFRDCAATTLAIADPEHVRIIATILGHSTITTSERHCNQARSLESGRRYQQTLKALKKSSPVRPRGLSNDRLPVGQRQRG